MSEVLEGWSVTAMKTVCVGKVGSGVSHGYGAIVCWQCRHVLYGVSEGYEGFACTVSKGSMRAIKAVSAVSSLLAWGSVRDIKVLSPM